MVGPGTYTGPDNRNLNTNGKADLTISSTGGRDATTFDLQRLGRFFQLDAAAGATVIQGFTVIHGNCSAIPALGAGEANGAGFRFLNSRAVVRNVAVRNMDCTSGGVNYPSFSGAAFCFMDSQALVEDALAEDNIANHGAGAASWGNDRSVVRNSVFMRSEGTYWGGALLMEENSTTEFHHCRFSYYKCDYGGAMDDGAFASPLFKDVIFEYGTGRYGSGLYHYGFSRTRYDGVLIQHNTGLSGTVYINSDTLPSMKNVTLFNNTSTAEASAIRCNYAGDTPLVFWQVRVVQNSAAEWGGGVTVYPSANITFQDCLFDGNAAMNGDGGALVIIQVGASSNIAPRTTVSVLNTTFVRNSASADGGAVLTQGTGSIVASFDKCTFQDNVGRDGGAAKLGTPGVVTFMNTQFIGNRARRSGGAVKVKNIEQVPAKLVFLGTAFEGNAAVTMGGALSCEEPNVVPPPPPTGLLFDGFRVAGSKVVQDGGGFHIMCTNLFMRNGTFEGNVAVEGSGGALLIAKAVNCSGATASSPIFDSVSLRNNSANAGGGGGVYFDHSVPSCRIPLSESAAAGGAPAFAWRWRDAATAAAATANNTAGFGNLQATPPARIELVCTSASAGSGCGAAPPGSNASVVVPAAYPGIRLALSVSMRDGFSQKVTSAQLQVAVVLGADDGTHFLEGVQRYWFEHGEAAVSEVSLTGPSSQKAVPVDIVIPQAIASAVGLTDLPGARVLLTIGPCPAGLIGASSAAGRYTCGACPTGRFAPASAKTCASCEAGHYSDTPGSSTCTTCPPGHRCPPGTTSPLPCPLGSYQADAGSDVCNRCDRGSYQELDKSTACELCPTSQTTLNNGAQSFAECVCPAGFYGNGTCTSCTAGMDCPAGSMAPEQEDGFFLRPTGSSGFEAFRCLPRHCLAGRAGLCADGRHGLACAECMEDHMPNSKGECTPCKANQLAAPLIITAICLVVIAALYFATGSNVNRQSYTQLTVLATGGQLFLTFQTIASMSSMQQVKWVEPMLSIMEALSILRFRIDLLQVQCIFRTDDPVAKYGMTLLVIPALCILFLAMCGILSLVFRHNINKNGVINALGLIVTICYLPITIICFSVMQCVRNPGGTFTLATMTSVVCGSSAQRLMLALGVINLVLLPIPVLCGVSLLTYIYPSIVANGGASVMLQRFRFMYQRFAPNTYYYAVLYMYRSFLVALPPVIFPEPGAIQIFVLGLIIVGFVEIQCVLWPWRTRLSNVLDAIFGYVLILLLMTTASLIVAPPDKVASDIGTFQYCVLVILLGGSLAVFGICFWRVAQRRRKKFGIFLSHHKGGAAALARLMRSHLESAAKCLVFLDCDHLETLDALFDIVRVDTERVVVILTEETLRRPWCAGELVTARQAGVPIIPMRKPGYEGLSDSAIQSIDTFWTPDEMLPLAVAGINHDIVKECYLHLRTLEQVEMPGELQCENDLQALRACFTQVVKLCMRRSVDLGPKSLPSNIVARLSKFGSGRMPEVSDTADMPSAEKVVRMRKGSDGSISSVRNSREGNLGGTCLGIVVDSSDMEGVCRAAVLQQFVMAETQWESHIFLSAEELQLSPLQPSGVLVLLTKGCLTSPRFACLLVLVRRKWPEVATVTVLADSQFCFPDKTRLASDVVPLAVRGEDMLTERDVAEAYGQVMNLLALPFFAESNIGAIKIAAARISERVSRKIGPVLSDMPPKEAKQPGCIDVLRARLSGPGGVEGLLIAQARRGARAYPEEPMAEPGPSPAGEVLSSEDEEIDCERGDDTYYFVRALRASPAAAKAKGDDGNMA